MAQRSARAELDPTDPQCMEFTSLTCCSMEKSRTEALRGPKQWLFIIGHRFSVVLTTGVTVVVTDEYLSWLTINSKQSPWCPTLVREGDT